MSAGPPPPPDAPGGGPPPGLVGSIVGASVGAGVLCWFIIIGFGCRSTKLGRVGAGAYFSMYGSVIPRAIPMAALGCIEGVLLKYAANHSDDFASFRYWHFGGAWYHPYAVRAWPGDAVSNEGTRGAAARGCRSEPHQVARPLSASSSPLHSPPPLSQCLPHLLL
jgi:hypothetical protein